ncbi:MAG: sigma-70 family RNA polymerase sigma factor [Candidatus Hydrogenedentes bacterium]|nr:sigma-70 family RNA polymerase sigma factor [Candidatus Hydrogenedentota bacterium]
MGDAELIRRIRAGETALFSHLVTSYAGLVWATCSSYIDNPVDREDVVQEIFTKCFLNLDSLRDVSVFGAWLHTLARRQCLDWLRSQKRARAALGRLQREMDTAPEQVHNHARGDLHRTIRGLIVGLPPRTREAMLLHYAEGYTMLEGARMLGTSPEAFKKRIQYGRRILTEQLSDELAPALREEKHREGLARAVVAGVPLGQAPWLTRVATPSAAPTVGIGLAGGTMKYAVVIGGLVILAGLITLSGVILPSSQTAAPVIPASSTPVTEPVADPNTAPIASGEPIPTEFQEVALANPATPPNGPAVVRGTVLDQSGRVAANAQVTLLPNPYLRSQNATQRWSIETTTDEDGRFVFDGLELSRYTLIAQRGDWAGRQLFSLGGVYADLVVSLAPGEYASGQVVDEQGQPVEGATVSVAEFIANGRYVSIMYDLDSSGSGHSTHLYVADVYNAITDNEGRFILGPLPGERFSLRTSHSGFAANVSNPLPIGAKDLRIVLGEGGRLTGRTVRDEDGAPVPDVPLVLVGNQRTEVYQTRSDEAGGFAMKHLREGTYEVVTEHGEGRVVAATDGLFVEVSASGEVAFVDVPLVEGGRVRGRVIDVGRGKAMAGACLEIISRDQFGLGDWSTRTDESGFYEFRGLRPGRYEFTLWANPNRNEYETRRSRDAMLTLGGRIDALDFYATSTDSISGRVVNPSGEGVAIAYVYARWPEVKNAQAVSRADGTFTLEGIPSGTEVILEAESGGFVSEAPRKVVAGTKEEVHVTLVEGGVVEGVVQKGGGAVPNSEQRIFIVGEGLPTYGKWAACSPAGRFRIGGLRGGNYAIRVGDGPALDIQVRAGSVTSGLVLENEIDGAPEASPTITTTQQSAIALAGNVTDQSGNPVAGVEVGVGYESSANVFTDVRGDFEVLGFPGKSREIQDLYRSGFLKRSSRERLSFPFGTKGIELVIERMGCVTGRVVDSETGAPVPEFEIALALEGDGDLLTAKGQYVKWIAGGNPAGTFRAEFNRDETFAVVLYARAPGYETLCEKIGELGPNIQLEDVTITLKPGGQVEGLVTAADGKPVIGAEIFAGTLDPSDMLHGVQPIAVSGPDGYYLIGSMPPGGCMVSVMHPNFEQAKLSLSITKSGVTRKDIRLGRGGVISGVVTRAGVPLTGGVFSVKVEEEFAQRSFNIDAQGRFSAGGLPGGVLRVQVGGYEQDVQLSANETRVMAIELPEATGQISGTLLFDGELPDEQSIFCQIRFPMLEGTYSVSTWARKGAYLLEDIPAGTGEVHVVVHLLDGSAERRIPVEIAEGESLQLDIDLADTEPPETNPYPSDRSIEVE